MSNVKRFTAVGAVMATLGGAAVLAQVQEARLKPAAPITSDIFSYDLDFDGTTLVGGAPFGTFSGLSQPGRAFVFRRTNGVWDAGQRLVANVLQAEARFGIAVTVDGDTVAVGAPNEDVSGVSNAGAVYVFQIFNGIWTQTAKLTATQMHQDANFGSALALQGDRLLIGARFDTVNNVGGLGAAYIFERSGLVWTQAARLTASDGAVGDDYGFSVALDGDLAVIGADDHDPNSMLDAGGAYVYEKTGGVWQETAQLTASDAGVNTHFGGAVAARGGVIVVGAEEQTHSLISEAGEAYVFESVAGQWQETTRLVAPDAGDGDHFGVDTAVDGNTILVGAVYDNSVYLFRRDGGQWRYKTQFGASDAGVLFGWRVALRGDLGAGAGPFYQTNRGAAYVFSGLHKTCCDANCDGATDFFDIDAFILALLDPAAFGAQYPGCDPLASDADGNGTLDFFDIDPFTTCMLSGGC